MRSVQNHTIVLQRFKEDRLGKAGFATAIWWSRAVQKRIKSATFWVVAQIQNCPSLKIVWRGNFVTFETLSYSSPSETTDQLHNTAPLFSSSYNKLLTQPLFFMFVAQVLHQHNVISSPLHHYFIHRFVHHYFIFIIFFFFFCVISV